MYKKTITYQTYDENPETIVEDFYFNLNEREITEMQNGKVGGLIQELNKIFADRDTPAMMEFFKNFILKAYGVRSADGKRMIKNEEVRQAFYETDAYNVLFMELFNDDTGKTLTEFMEKVTGTYGQTPSTENLQILKKQAPTLANAIEIEQKTEG